MLNRIANRTAVVTLCSSRCLSLCSWPQFLHFNSPFRRLFITIYFYFFYFFSFSSLSFPFLLLLFNSSQSLSLSLFLPSSLRLWIYSCGLYGPSGPHFHTHLKHILLFPKTCINIFFPLLSLFFFFSLVSSPSLVQSFSFPKFIFCLGFDMIVTIALLRSSIPERIFHVEFPAQC